MNYHELLQSAKKELIQAGKEEQDARLLLFDMKNWTSQQYLLYGREIVAKEEIEEFQRRIERRKNGEPVQEIIGFQNFYGYEIAVNSKVLTPRPETEQLVTLALKAIANYFEPKVMDLCTGSGCIAIAIAKENPTAHIVGVDISEEALKVARENATRNTAPRIRWKQSDMFEKLEEELFDIIISNPPYIPSQEILELEQEVRLYDPLLALDGGEDGLRFYRQIAEQGQKYLRNPSLKEQELQIPQLFLEIGDGQGDAICRILEENRWKNVKVLPDYTGRERMIVAEVGEK